MWVRRESAASLAFGAALLCVASICMGAPARAQSIPAATHHIESNGRGGTTPDTTTGWSFRVTREVIVTDLGFFDMLEASSGSIGDGLHEPHSVGIWHESGTLVVSGVVAGGTAAPLEAGFRYVAVPETTLEPGEIYVIGSHWPSTCNFTIGGSGDCSVSYAQAGVFTPPKFTWDPAVYPIERRWGGVGFAMPPSSGLNPAFGPSFKFELGAAPPPPPPAPPGEVSIEDPVGDVTLFSGPLPPGSPSPPELVSVRAGFDATHLHVDVSFAPGTMNPGGTGTFYLLGLDLDLNALTGASFIPGAEAMLFFASDLQSATICGTTLDPAVCTTSIPVQLGADDLSVSIPLGPDGIDDDGAARFGFVAGYFLDGIPVSEDVAFGGVSGSLDRVFAAVSGNLLAAPVPALAPLGAIGLALALVAAARREL